MFTFEVISASILLLASSAVLIACNYSALHPILDYGKLIQGRDISSSKLKILFNILVPKQWFYHFYTELLILIIAKCLYFGRYPGLREVLLLIQGSRRLYEQLFVFPKSNATMHLTHYAMGMLLYAIEAFYSPSESSYRCVAIILFIIGSMWQNSCHRALAGTKKYDIPQFPITSSYSALTTACPHYGAELLIYIAFLIMNPSFIPVATVIWIAISLGTSGQRSKEYYNKKCTDTNTHIKWAIFPLIY